MKKPDSNDNAPETGSGAFRVRVQPAGLLLVLNEPDFTILQISNSAFQFTGYPPHELVQQPLERLFPPEKVALLRQFLLQHRPFTPQYLFNVVLNNGKIPFEIMAHREEDVIVLEMLPVQTEPEPPGIPVFGQLKQALNLLRNTTTLKELCRVGAEQVKELSGYDRVFIYRYNRPGNNGYVIARAPEPDSFSLYDLSQPVPHIPQHSRGDYGHRLTRVLFDTGVEAVDLEPSLNPLTGKSLRLEQALLQKPNPHYLHFLREKGVGCSLSFALVRDETLWGLLVCQHHEPKRLPQTVWMACEILAQTISLQIPSRESNEWHFDQPGDAPQIQQVLDSIKEFGELRDRFITTVSHQFRTPVAAILSSAEILQNYSEKLGEDKKQEHLQRIRNAALQITRVLDDMLLLDKAESGKLRFSPGLLNLHQICEEVQAEIARTSLVEHPFVFNYAAPEEAILDGAILRQILGNLLSNAAKFSPPGSPVVFEVFSEPGFLVFQISDRGKGIPEGEQDRIFDLFHRGKNVINTPGSGLGLSIVRVGVDMHGGTIDLKSDEQAGTTVTVKLPLHPAGH